MSDAAPAFRLTACRELMDRYPESLVIRQRVEALEAAMPDRPGEVVSFCRSIIETTCKTIISDFKQPVDDTWNTQKLLREALRYSILEGAQDGALDPRLRDNLKHLVRGLSAIVDGVGSIRNDYGTAAHGADAYAALLDASFAEILARSTDAAVGLLFKAHLARAQSQPLPRLAYTDYADFNESIDESFGPFVVLDVPLPASEALFYVERDTYRSALLDFTQQASDLESAQEDDAG